MENRGKNKDAIIIILLVVLLVVVSGFCVWFLTKDNDNQPQTNNTNQGVNNTQQDTEKDEETEKQEDEGKEEEKQEDEGKEEAKQEDEGKEEEKQEDKEEPKVDPYKNYKNIIWCGTSAKSRTGKTMSIKNNEVYLENTKVKGIKGTPIKIKAYIAGGVSCFHVLTKEGKVYSIEEFDLESITVFADLSKYNVIDMASSGYGGVREETVYFLTSDGRLINKKGYTFEELNKDFVATYGARMPLATLYFNKAGNVYYLKDETANYITLKDKAGKQVKAKVVFMQGRAEVPFQFIILTEDNQIITINEDMKVGYESAKYRTYIITRKYTSTDSYTNNLDIVTTEGKVQSMEDMYDDYYNVSKAKRVEFDISMLVEIPYKNSGTLATELKDISSKVQTQIINSYDGSTLTGADVISACMTYSASQEVSIKVVLDKASQYGTGKYEVRITDRVLSTLTAPRKGGISVSPTGDYDRYITQENQLETIKNKVNNYDTYYSYLMKDSSTQKILGIVFVKKQKESTGLTEDKTLSTYDGFLLSGSEVAAAYVNYAESQDVSIKVVFDKNEQYGVGKYAVKISDSVLSTLTTTIKGGINVLPTGANGTYVDQVNELSLISKRFDGRDSFYSYLMKDTTTNKTMGIVFVRKGANLK